MTYARPDTLELTEDPAANALVAQDPMAFLIGWLLDQQTKVQIAFAGPGRLLERLGTLDAAELAAMGSERIVEACADKPAVHRYPRNMGARIHELAQHVVDEYDGDAEQVWLTAGNYATLKRRIVALPGFGKGKAPGVTAMLVNRFGLPGMRGFKQELYPYGSLGDVVVYEDLLAYQERKGVWKRRQKAKAERAKAARA